MINKTIQPKKTGMLGRILGYIANRYVAPAVLALGASSCAVDGYVSGGASLMIPQGSNSSQTEYGTTLGAQGGVGLRTKKGFGLEARLNLSQSSTDNIENLDVMTDFAMKIEAAEIGGVKIVPYARAGNLWSISDINVPGVESETQTSNTSYMGFGCNVEGKRWYAGIERLQFGIGEDPKNVDSLLLLQGGAKYNF